MWGGGWEERKANRTLLASLFSIIPEVLIAMIKLSTARRSERSFVPLFSSDLRISLVCHGFFRKPLYGSHLLLLKTVFPGVLTAFFLNGLEETYTKWLVCSFFLFKEL